MTKTVIRPSLSEFVFLIIWMIIGVLFLYVAYLSSWSLDFSKTDASEYVLIESFGPDGFSFGFFTFGLVLAVVATEFLGRSVTLDEGFVSSRSPLGLYRERLKISEISEIRMTRLFGWGRIMEVRSRGRWIVLMGNSILKDRPHAFLSAGTAGK